MPCDRLTRFWCTSRPRRWPSSSSGSRRPAQARSTPRAAAASVGAFPRRSASHRVVPGHRQHGTAGRPDEDDGNSEFLEYPHDPVTDAELRTERNPWSQAFPTDGNLHRNPRVIPHLHHDPRPATALTSRHPTRRPLGTPPGPWNRRPPTRQPGTTPHPPPKNNINNRAGRDSRPDDHSRE